MRESFATAFGKPRKELNADGTMLLVTRAVGEIVSAVPTLDSPAKVTNHEDYYWLGFRARGNFEQAKRDALTVANILENA
jgi:hypothetical protein